MRGYYERCVLKEGHLLENNTVSIISLLLRVEYFYILYFYNSHCSVLTKNYQHTLALVFAVREINENREILPNITVGFNIYNSYYNARQTYHATMELLSTKNRLIPNYRCDNKQNNLITVIGGLEPETSLHIATILSIYNIPQVECIFEV